MISFLVSVSCCLLKTLRAADSFANSPYYYAPDDIDPLELHRIVSDHHMNLDTEDYFDGNFMSDYENSFQVQESQSLRSVQALLEACLRENHFFQNLMAPCYSSWLLLVAQKVLSASARSISQADLHAVVLRAQELRIYVPSEVDLEMFAQLEHISFDFLVRNQGLNAEERVGAMIKEWAGAMRTPEITLHELTLTLALWTFSLTHTVSDLKRRVSPQDKNPIVPVSFDPLYLTLTHAPFESVYEIPAPVVQPKVNLPAKSTKSTSSIVSVILAKKIRPKIDAKHYNKMFVTLKKILRVDLTQKFHADITNGTLIGLIDNQIKKRLIPMAIEKLRSGSAILLPIHQKCPITLERLKKLESIDSAKNLNPSSWITNALLALTGDQSVLFRVAAENAEMFTFWYTSLTLLALGPSPLIYYDPSQDALI